MVDQPGTMQTGPGVVVGSRPSPASPRRARTPRRRRCLPGPAISRTSAPSLSRQMWMLGWFVSVAVASSWPVTASRRSRLSARRRSASPAPWRSSDRRRVRSPGPATSPVSTNGASGADVAAVAGRASRAPEPGPPPSPGPQVPRCHPFRLRMSRPSTPIPPRRSCRRSPPPPRRRFRAPAAPWRTIREFFWSAFIGWPSGRVYGRRASSFNQRRPRFGLPQDLPHSSDVGRPGCSSRNRRARSRASSRRPGLPQRRDGDRVPLLREPPSGKRRACSRTSASACAGSWGSARCAAPTRRSSSSASVTVCAGGSADGCSFDGGRGRLLAGRRVPAARARAVARRGDARAFGGGRRVRAPPARAATMSGPGPGSAAGARAGLERRGLARRPPMPMMPGHPRRSRERARDRQRHRRLRQSGQPDGGGARFRRRRGDPRRRGPQHRRAERAQLRLRGTAAARRVKATPERRARRRQHPETLRIAVVASLRLRQAGQVLAQHLADRAPREAQPRVGRGERAGERARLSRPSEAPRSRRGRRPRAAAVGNRSERGLERAERLAIGGLRPSGETPAATLRRLGVEPLVAAVRPPSKVGGDPQADPVDERSQRRPGQEIAARRSCRTTKTC